MERSARFALALCLLGLACSTTLAQTFKMDGQCATQASPTPQAAASPETSLSESEEVSPTPTAFSQAVAPMTSVNPSPSPTPEKPLVLAGRFGFGYNPVSGFYEMDYWLSEKSALDLLFSSNTYGNPSFDFNPNATSQSNDGWGLGLVYRNNLLAPARNLRFQGLVIADYSYNDNYLSNLNNNLVTEIYENKNENFQWGVGLGFEYFLPFCDSLSLQSALFYTATANFYTYRNVYNPSQSGNPPNSNQTNFYLRVGDFSNSGLTLNAVNIHFYF